MPGPPPNPNARRRNARPDWISLPATGREGEVPEYPIPAPAGKNEDEQAAFDAHRAAVLDVWADLWTSPQAVAWEALGWTRVVARYADNLVASERPGSSVALLAEVRQMEDRLGLTPMAMKRLQWNIVGTAAQDNDGEADVARLDDYRARLG